MKKLLVRLVRQSPAMIVAMLALFVALTGTAVATTSALIGSAQIRNNSITGLDVKNRSLRPIDFRGSVRGPRGLRGLTGAAGAQGAQGAQGVQGIQGPIGPSTGYSVDSGNNVLAWTGGAQTVQSLSLPAGSYVLLGKLIANNNSAAAADVNCNLSLDGVVDSGFDVVTTGTSGDDRHYMVMAGTKTVAAAATATMTCTTAATSGNYLNRVITAVKVGALG